MSDFADRVARLSPAKLRLLAFELQDRFEAAERSRTEPIAVIGIGCRFPAGADTPERFWRLLRDGTDAVTEVPPDRWNLASFYDSNPDEPGKMYTRWGAFLDEVERFDAGFFGIAPREAMLLDPQQRLLLEVSWEALERAAKAPDRLAGSDTGVFVGISSNDYSHLQWHGANARRLTPYTVSGNAFSVAVGRLSYVLGLHGPSMAVDTACSSSLVAVHLACQSLRAGECRLALAGGVNLILSPAATISFSKARMMSADGRCKTFDAAADGYVRGEGCGIVVLERLSRALAAGDPIRAVIRGSAVTQDGRKAGLTVPNGLEQQSVITKALAAAGVDASQLGYVEAHGTGTALGDPVEMRALGEVLRAGRSPESPVLVGSVKTNVGHLEAAAGIAGLIKTILAIEHQEIPPHLHLRRVNPEIPLADLPIEIPVTVRPWRERAGPRLAGVSSFGFAGTNAHVVIAEAPHAARVDRAPRPGRVFVLPLSGRSETAAQAVAGRFAAVFGATDDVDVHAACFTAATGRMHMPHRLAVIGESPADMRDALAVASTGRPHERVLRGTFDDRRRPRVAFLFTGEGAQYSGMGRGLYDGEPRVRTVLDACDAELRPLVPGSLVDVLFGTDDGRVHERRYAEPALFALEVAVADLWRHWGVEPDIVLGHGVGEYAAACVAGALTKAEGLKLAAERGRLIEGQPEHGSMRATSMQAFSVPFVANVTGERFPSGSRLDAEYWVRQLREPGRVSDSVATLVAAGVDAIVEIGPHPALIDSVTRCPGTDRIFKLPSLQRGRSDLHVVAAAAAALYAAGVGLDWTNLLGPAERVVLPTYPFERERYWADPVPPAAVWDRQQAQEHGGLHPLLGRRVDLADRPRHAVWDVTIANDEAAYLGDHRIHGTVAVPMSVYLELARAASAELLGLGTHIVNDLELRTPLLLGDGPAPAIQLILAPDEAGNTAFRLYSRRAAGRQPWTMHAVATIRTSLADAI